MKTEEKCFVRRFGHKNGEMDGCTSAFGLHRRASLRSNVFECLDWERYLIS